MQSPPSFIPALLEAVAHQQAGRLEAASAGFAAVLDVEPQQPQALFFGGVLALRGGHTTRAIDLLGRSIAVRPTHAESHFALGNAFWSAGRREAARGAWNEALLHEETHLGALLNLARAQEQAGESEDAVRTTSRALALAPDQALIHAAHASALRADAQFRAALTAAQTAIAKDPSLAQGHYQLGTTLKAIGRSAEAVDAFRAALTLTPHDASIHLNLANALFDLDDPAAAERHCRAARAADPDMAEAHAMLGYLLTQANLLEPAIAACRRAIELRPDLAEGHWNLGIALLSSGDLPGGFARYEWRKRHPLYAQEFRRLPSPEWRGESLAGRKLLILAEQGLGDTIMFARFASVLRNEGAEVTLACDRRLIPLLEGVDGLSHVVPNASSIEAPDLWVDQMSLPLHCDTTIDSIPSVAGYIASSPALSAKWRSRIVRRPGANRLVGVAWAGNPLHSNDHNRSCPSSVFAALAGIPGVQLVSLQVGDRAGEAASLGMPDLSRELTDFAQTASVIDNLDLVVSVDTSVAHLAASMGKPTWILLPFCPDWRWMSERTDSPWYRSVRLFRQRQPGDWQPIGAAVAKALTDIAALSPA